MDNFPAVRSTHKWGSAQLTVRFKLLCQAGRPLANVRGSILPDEIGSRCVAIVDPGRADEVKL